VLGFLVKYYEEHKVTHPCADDNSVWRLTELHFPRRILQRKGNQKPVQWCVVWKDYKRLSVSWLLCTLACVWVFKGVSYQEGFVR
jgi:hypothetical protein